MVAAVVAEATCMLRCALVMFCKPESQRLLRVWYPGWRAEQVPELRRLKTAPGNGTLSRINRLGLRGWLHSASVLTGLE